MKNIIVVGLGEVGEPIKLIEEQAGNEVWVREISGHHPLPPKGTKVDVMHVCTPHLTDIQYKIIEWDKFHNPKLIIIHSTIPVGVTKQIAAHVKAAIVHSPIRGVHPHLYEGIKTFKKLVGGDDKAAKLACKHLKDIGLEPLHIGCSDNTELAKILSTAYYGWNILFAKQVNQLCTQLGLDYDNVYKIPNETYNEGYKKLDMERFIRPVLTPPPGRIGGHCVTQNVVFLPPSRLKQIIEELN